MALFSKNANRAALFKKQTLYDKCCTPEVEECCYFANLLPRPPAPPPCQTCVIDRYYIVNGINVGNPTTIVIDTSMLPTIIEVFFNNSGRSCDAIIGRITSASGNPNISITTYSVDAISPGTAELAATIELNTVLGEGTYTPFLEYSLCGDNYSLGIDIQINAV